MVPEPAHGGKIEIQSGFEVAITGGREGAVRDRVEQRLEANLRSAAAGSQHGHARGQRSARAVTGHGETRAIEPDGAALAAVHSSAR